MTHVADLELEDPDGRTVRLGDLLRDDGRPRWLVVQALRYYG